MESMNSPGSGLLLLAATLSALAALAHVGVVIIGPSWYRLFGAGEGMARLAESGSWYPALITLGIAAVLALWSGYALSGAGLLPALPLLRTALVAISAVYLMRAAGGFVLAFVAPGANGQPFWLWSSAICLVIGAVHAAGLALRWPVLSGGNA